MRVLVTGGTGLLGNNVIRLLSGRVDRVRALIRSQTDEAIFDGAQADFVFGDVTDPASIEAAVAGCQAVIHSAGLIQLGWSRLNESMQVNRDGTRNIVDACIQHDAALVHVGTVNTLAVGSRDAPADETTDISHAGGQVPSSYVVSKRAGVDEVQRGIQRGLRAVIVHPGFMLGPYDWKPSSGRMILEVGKHWQPIAPIGGCSVCDVRDVARGTINAMTQLLEGNIESGRQYILAGENKTYVDLWREMARRMGTRGPVMRAGPAMRILAGTAGDIWTRIVGREPDLNSAGVRMSSQFHWHISDRARRELDYQNRPTSDTLDEATEWLRQHHKIR